MGFRLKKAEVLTLKSKEEVLKLARRLNAHGGIECERQEKAAREAKIRAKILGGEMRPFTWALGKVLENSTTARVDGQHSSRVFETLGEEDWASVKLPVVVFWEEHDCDKMTDLALLFEQFNPPWSSRNAEDLMGAHAGIHEDLKPLLKDRHVAVKVAAEVT